MISSFPSVIYAAQSGSWTVAATQSGTWTVTGAGGTFPVTDSGGSLTVDDGGGSLTVDGAVSATQSGTWAVEATQSGAWTVSVSGTVAVSDGGGTLTVDDGGSTLSIDDGAGSITVDGTVAVSAISGTSAVNLSQYGGSAVGADNAVHVQPGTGATWAASQSGTWTVQAAQSGSWTVAATQSGSWSVSVSGTVTVDSELTTADLDTGAGTDTRAVVGLVYAASGGAVTVSASNPLPVTATQSGSWTVAATQSGSWSVSQTGTWTVQAAQSGSWSVSVSGTATVDTELPAAAALADGVGNPTTPLVGSCQMRWNGATWDREQATQEGTLLASAARTSDTTSADQTNYTARGVMVYVRVSAGTPNLSVYIQLKDPISGLYANANATPTAITATGLYCYELSPGGTVAGQQVYQRTGGHLPRTWRIYVVHNNANSITYSVAYCYLV